MISRLLSLFTFIFIFAVTAFSQAQAQVVVRLSQPESPTRQAQVQLGFTALSTTGETITANCQVRQPNQTSFSTFESQALKAGGDSGICNYQMSAQGEYRFRVQAVSSSQTQLSNTTIVNYQTRNPDRIENYQKTQLSQCQYQISFSTPSDTRVSKIEIFRSTTTSINTSSSNRVYFQDVNPSQDITRVDTIANCDQDEYFYAVRTLDQAGNSSALVGDQLIVEVPTQTQSPPAPASSPASAPQPGPATPQSVAPESDEAELEETEPPETEIVPVVPDTFSPESTPEDGQVLGEVDEAAGRDFSQLLLYIGGILLLSGFTTGTIMYLNR